MSPSTSVDLLANQDENLFNAFTASAELKIQVAVVYLHKQYMYMTQIIIFIFIIINQPDKLPHQYRQQLVRYSSWHRCLVLGSADFHSLRSYMIWYELETRDRSWHCTMTTDSSLTSLTFVTNTTTYTQTTTSTAIDVTRRKTENISAILLSKFKLSLIRMHNYISTVIMLITTS